MKKVNKRTKSKTPRVPQTGRTLGVCFKKKGPKSGCQKECLAFGLFDSQDFEGDIP